MLPRAVVRLAVLFAGISLASSPWSVASAAPPSAAPPSAAPPSAAPPSAAPPSAAPPSAAPPSAAPPSAAPPGPAPVSSDPAADGGWGAEEATPTAPQPEQAVEPAAPVAVATGYTMPPPADPALMERNRKLSAQMQRGERWLIGGRVGAPLSLVPTLIGAVLLGTYSARSRAEAYSRSGAYESLSPPPNRAMLMGGIAFTVVGVGGLATSIYAAVHGFRLMQSARAGQFAFDAGPRHAALTFRARF